MNTLTIEQLNQDYSLKNSNGSLNFKVGEGDIPLVEIYCQHANALISLQGAHLMKWQPTGEDNVIWLSENASFAPGKSIRGGIPVCWPWFGAHESNDSYPAHGFARTEYWRVTGTQQLTSGEIQITFTLETQSLNESIQQMWPHTTIAVYTLTIGRTLTLELTTHNASNHTITLGQALHTYFNVEDVSHTTIYGLEGKNYLDKSDNFKLKTQSGPITITQEVDRIYLRTPDDIIIDDKNRKIIIRKHGSRSTIVWNPWKEVADKMGDLGKAGYLKMLCVESANAAEDTITIAPGEKYQLRVVYEVENN